MNIKKEIINKIKNDSKEDIQNMINDALTTEDELTLPGLGVLFTLAWNNTNNQNQILESIIKGLKN